MQKLSQQALKGAKVVDKLVKAYLKDGSEQWILVHIEVQGDEDKDFSQRCSATSIKSSSDTAGRC